MPDARASNHVMRGIRNRWSVRMCTRCVSLPCAAITRPWAHVTGALRSPAAVRGGRLVSAAHARDEIGPTGGIDEVEALNPAAPSDHDAYRAAGVTTVRQSETGSSDTGRKIVQIAPSILSADIVALGRDIAAVERGGADLIRRRHGRALVPNITIGPPMVRAIKRIATRPLDVHLLIEDPDRYIDDFAAAGADMLSVHVETVPHLHRTIGYIKARGLEAGAVLNPVNAGRRAGRDRPRPRLRPRDVSQSQFRRSGVHSAWPGEAAPRARAADGDPLFGADRGGWRHRRGRCPHRRCCRRDRGGCRRRFPPRAAPGGAPARAVGAAAYVVPWP